MNKKEAIEKLEYLKRLLEEGSKDSYNHGFINALKYTLNIVKQLKEQEKPKVPQFVADWYKDNQYDFEFNLYRLCVDYYNCNLDIETMIWLRDRHNNPIQTLTAMHQVGYTIKEEKEKLYQVELPGSHKHGDIILVKDDDGDITYDVVFSDKWKERDYTKLTEAEIKQDFGWAWQFAEEVEE